MTYNKPAWVRFAALLWFLAAASWATYQVFGHPTEVTTGAATAYGTLLGLPSLALFKWQLRKGEMD